VYSTLSVRRLACYVLVEPQVVVLVELLQGLVEVELKPVTGARRLEVGNRNRQCLQVGYKGLGDVRDLRLHVGDVASTSATIRLIKCDMPCQLQTRFAKASKSGS